MNAGDLNHRIRIERRVRSIDRLNQNAYTWETLAVVWAAVKPLRGREFFEAGQTQSEVTVKFTIRYRTGVDDTMRVVWKNAPYGIVAPPIEVSGAREFVELMCRNGVGDGKN